MNFIKKNLLFVSTLLGAVFGYAILHPFGLTVHAFFHMHKERYVHLHWDEVLASFTKAFSLSHWPEAVSYIFLSGVIGFLFGKTIIAYRTINEQLKTFSAIGINASSIIHDLNSPLARLTGYTELLKSEIDDTQQINYCEKIQRQIAHLFKMVMDIKITAQGTKAIELSKVPTNLNLFLKDFISNTTFHSEIRINPKFDGEVLIDKGYFERALWNLVKNADEALAGTEDAKIEISINELDNFVIISISDNGPGLPSKILKHLFKVGQTYKKKGGTGLGLYNCKKIVEAHGGKTWLISEVGKGTTAYIKIPK